MSEMYDTLLGQGLAPGVAKKLDEIHQSGQLTIDELDDRALEALKEFSEADAGAVLGQFTKSDLSHVQNKSAFLCGVMKTYRAKMKNATTPAASSTTAGATGSTEVKEEAKTGPHEEKVKELLDRTGYTLDITTGQRKYGGPPPNWEGCHPGTGEKKFCSQIFIGKIPRDMYEDELVPMFEPHGTIYDLRIMVDPFTGFNKGFAFCTFATKEEAVKAVKVMDGHKTRDSKTLGVCISQANNRLFVGSIPKSKTKQQIFDEFEKNVEELNDVIVYISAEDKSKNRGFAFLEFTTHKDAALARRKLMSGRIKVFGNISPTVDWADPQEEPDDDVMSKVKVVYVRNLTPACEEVKLNELFKQYGNVEKVKKIKDYAFVHFTERDDAVRSIEELNGQELDDVKIEVSLAKPQTDNKKKEGRRGQSGFGALNRGRGRGGPRGGRGGYPHGGFHQPYGPPPPAYGYGGYGYDDSSYDSYYAMPPPPPRGRGMARGMPMRGGRGFAGFRGGPRGAPRGGPRGGPRGAMRGGRGRGGVAPKRKMEGAAGYDGAKRRFGQENAGGWNPQPIAQQPLKAEQSYYGADYSTGGQEWYQDSYGTQWK